MELDAHTIDTLSRRIVAFIHRHALSTPDVALEDIVQATWLRILDGRARFEGRSRLDTFVLGVAYNVWRDARRKSFHRARLTAELVAEEAGAPMSSDPLATVDPSARASAAVAMAGLGERDRWLIEARVFEDQTYAEILPRYRERFGAAVSTEPGLRTAYFVARRRLAERWAPAAASC
ncbi:MAG: hypothetical protein H6745_30495 [Deltaproteobacteria bacterium]|nr:hypothetical protein [Deltaproteobacteria bacterium]